LIIGAAIRGRTLPSTALRPPCAAPNGAREHPRKDDDEGTEILARPPHGTRRDGARRVVAGVAERAVAAEWRGGIFAVPSAGVVALIRRRSLDVPPIVGARFATIVGEGEAGSTDTKRDHEDGEKSMTHGAWPLAQSLPGERAMTPPPLRILWCRPSRALRGLVVAAGAVATLVATAPRLAFAQAAPQAAQQPAPIDVAPDVALHEAAPPERHFSLELNPLSLIIGRISAQLLIVPVNHHALVLNPFYAWTTTNPIYTDDAQGNATQLPVQKFTGFGGEIGYRYYTGLGGPRGFFVGPSFIIADMNVKAQNGSSTSYTDLGFAVDVGYQLLVIDRVSLAVGAGVQYTTPTSSIPPQQFPADVYANSRVFPRALASIGWAF
jgi:Protein of unknown function (DUF3575)